MSKLPHKIVVFTGGIASGKTTVKEILIRMFNSLNIKYTEIKGSNDLYLPFAIKQGLMESKDTYERPEVTALVEVLYAKYGRSIGSILLKEYLVDKPADTIYIIDSKRNPEGIRELKEIAEHVYVIGSHADFDERIERYTKRNRDFDTQGGILREPTMVFKREEDVFRISEAVALSDTVIENHERFPYDIEVNLFIGLVQKGFIALLDEAPPIGLPRRGENWTTEQVILQEEDVPIILDQFIRENAGKDLFVVQGGNRFVSTYLDKKTDRSIHNTKILCLSKVKLSVVLNTILSQQERVTHLTIVQQHNIINDFPHLSTETQEKINTSYNQRGFTSLHDFLSYTTVSEALKVFGDFVVPTPFSYPADDRKLKQEFQKIFPFAKQTIENMEERTIIKVLLENTSFYIAVTDSNREAVFIDDLLYRGRTYYTLTVLTLLLGVPPTWWRFYTLAEYRVSKGLTSENLHVLRRGVEYPFQNSIQTERGYWEETRDYFVFRDIIHYRYLLSLSSLGNNDDSEKVQRSWTHILKRVTKILRVKGLPAETVKILVELYIFYQVHNLPMHIGAIVDQRPKGIGYCMQHVKMLSVWINLEEPRQKRHLFKDKVKQCLLAIDALKDAEAWTFVEDARRFYQENSVILDYLFLKEFYGDV